MSTIPLNSLISVQPGVIAASGTAIDLNGLLLSSGARVPIGQVLSFADEEAVEQYFGAASKEYQFAAGGAGLGSGYFGGYENSTKSPGALLIAQYPTANVSAYMRGGAVSALTLSQLQAISGTLSIVIDGSTKAGSINLSSATSFSNAAELIGETLAIEGAASATFTGAIATGVLTASSVTGNLSVGDVIAGAGVTAGTYIASLGTGTGGAGTYNVLPSQTVASEAMTANLPGVVFDSVSGAFIIISATTGTNSTMAYATGTTAASLALTQATGAVLSQGAVAATPAAFMSAIINQTQNWASFTTDFDPDGGSGFANKLAFSAWANSTDFRYVYVAWDTDITPTESSPATGSFGYAIQQAEYSGTCPNWEPGDTNLAAFVMGSIASINFEQTNGRITFAYRSQSGLVPGVTNVTAAVNLAGNPQASGSFGNGYNFYGAYGDGEDSNDGNVYQRGTVSGPFAFLDSFVNQIWLNNLFQATSFAYMKVVNSFPYTPAGYSAFELAMQSVIDAGLNFGAYAGGVALSSAQISEVNTAAGTNIAGTLANQGWYLQVKDPGATARASRGSPIINFWYVDGGSVQSLSIASIAVQ